MAKLKPRARIIRTIGDQLISGPEAALIELVKNSYDADATWIKIKITPREPENPTGLVQIEDNGHGMTEDDITNKWFEPATDEKKIHNLSKSGLRRVLGAKGIGRFASSRLGKNTELISIAKKSDNTLEKTNVNIDWGIFESEKYLADLDIPINSKIIDSSSNCGLKIVITEILVSWTENDIRKIIKELRKIVSPQEIQGEFKIYLDISSFKKSDESSNPSNFDGDTVLKEELSNDLNTNADSLTESNLILPYKIQDSADYVLSGKFDCDGNFSGTFCIERGDNINQDIFVTPPKTEDYESDCGEFDIVLKVYDGESDSVLNLFKRMGVSNIGVREARKILSLNSGVAIYRNGFRVRPYGESDFDWLTLEKRRVQDPSKKIGHSQISGKIIIGSENESDLIERSSREGFEHNGAFFRLKNLITHVMLRIEEKRFEYREKAGLSRKPKGDVSKIKNIAKFNKLIEASKDLPIAFQQKFLDTIEKESSELNKSIEELEAYQKLLESRSALGLVVAQVIHDGRRYLDPISFAAESLISEKDFLLEQTKRGEIVRKHYPMHAHTILNSAKGLGTLFKSLDPVSGRKRGRPVNFSVRDTINITLDLLAESLIEGNIQCICDAPQELLTYGYKSDLQSALLNIIDNAIHWLNTINDENKIIKITANIEENKIKIAISNNGPLIEPLFSSRLFEAGFTLKSEGHGLGLIIAREACRASKGDLYLNDMAIDTTFIIEFPLEEKA